jgi:NADPH:quinone reductase-like Zn-dependent oxidoreductase
MRDLPATQTAIVGLHGEALGISRNVGLPELGEDMVMVKTVAVAVNPVDTKMTGDLASPGAIAGVDFSGTVVAIGSNAQTPTPVAIGDRLCGAVEGMHSLTPRMGATWERLPL